MRAHHLERALLRSEALTVREEWARVRSRPLRIADRQICPSCSKRIGKVEFLPLFVLVLFIVFQKDVTFVLLPGDEEIVMHYVCYAQEKQEP